LNFEVSEFELKQGTSKGSKNNFQAVANSSNDSLGLGTGWPENKGPQTLKYK